MRFLAITIFAVLSSGISPSKNHAEENSWIRINFLGYKPGGIKIAVWCSKENKTISSFQLIDSATNKIVYQNKAGKEYGAYGPFLQTCRLNFSSFGKSGKYYLKANGV